ncbi:MAG: DUF2799 domain-containing protein [Pseudomonadaceae bacterium]|nr:DUF2799 domain-containing protein [Pseudomonadaceae bacterium]
MTRVSKTRVIFLAAALVLTGCASKPSVTEYQCRAGDWQSIGFRDGANGVANTHILAHQEACGEFGIVPERDGYLAGWREGLNNYCTAQNGYQLGVRGSGMNTVCPEALQSPFAAAYADGRQIYEAQREVSRLASQIQRDEQRLLQIKEELVGTTTAQLVPDLTVEERVQLVAKFESLLDERASIKTRLPELEYALDTAEIRLAELHQTLAYR